MTEDEMAQKVKDAVAELSHKIAAAEEIGLSVDLNYSFSESIGGAKQHHFATRVYKVI